MITPCHKRLMLLAFLPALFQTAFASHRQTPEITIDHDDTIITSSVRIRPNTYVFQDPNRNGVVLVQADNVTIDFQGATLESVVDPTALRENFDGIGVSIQGHQNVHIINANIYGYKRNVSAIDSPGTTVQKSNLSYNRTAVLWQDGWPVYSSVDLRNSTQWGNLGAGVWLERSSKSVVTNCIASGGTIGVTLLDSDSCIVQNNDVSYNSGWGVVLSESGDNEVSWNHVDFVNRPYYGWGGDSAGIAIASNSNGNYIVGNSVTHGGDGIFLTDRLDGTGFPTGDGPSNDNVIAYNDTAFSPHNAIEGTYSFRNTYYQNDASDSDYGFWLGLSRDSLALENRIHSAATDGIHIDGGVGNVLAGNTIYATKSGISFMNHTLSPSNHNDIRLNTFLRADRQISLDSTTDNLMADNIFDASRPDLSLRSALRASIPLDTQFVGSAQYTRMQTILAQRPAGFVFYRDLGLPLGVGWLQADRYEPRDYRNMTYAWRALSQSKIQLVQVRTGMYSIDTPAGVTLTRLTSDGKQYLAKLSPGSPDEGPGTYLDATLTVRQSLLPVQTITTPMLSTNWDVKWYQWDQSHPWSDSAYWEALFASTPLLHETLQDIAGDFSFAPPAPGISPYYFAFQAETVVKFPAGTYKLNFLYDDSARVYVDDVLVLDGWQGIPAYQGTTVNFPTDGNHKVRVRFGQGPGNAYLLWSIARQGS